MRRGRLLILCTNVALFAGWLQFVVKSFGGTWSDGH
jgi:hypothetical protein